MKLFFFTAVGAPSDGSPCTPRTLHTPRYGPPLSTHQGGPKVWPKQSEILVFIQLSGTWQNFCAWTAIIMWRTFRGLGSYQSGFPCWANSADVPRC